MSKSRIAVSLKHRRYDETRRPPPGVGRGETQRSMVIRPIASPNTRANFDRRCNGTVNISMAYVTPDIIP